MITARIKPRPRLKAVVTRPYQGKGYSEGYEAGQQAEYDRFWDAYQDGGNRTNYYQRFVQDGWNDETFKPKYPIICKGSSTAARSVFYNGRMTKIEVPIIVIGVSAREMCNQATLLESMSHLELIGVTDCSAMFSGCAKLRDLNIVGSIDVDFSVVAAEHLSSDSVDSIINALQTGAGKTLTLHETVAGNMTADQKARVTQKGWTLVY